MTEAVHAGVLAIPRRQARARFRTRETAGPQDLGPEVHDEPHAESGRAIRVVRARHIVLKPCEREAMVTGELSADLMHQDVAPGCQRAADGGDAAVDPRQLARG